MSLLEGKKGIVLGVANERSIAWAIAKAAVEEGGQVAIGAQNDRMAGSAQKLIDGTPMRMFLCDLNIEEDLERVRKELESTYGKLDFVVHSVAFALREDLTEPFIKTSREGFRVALETSAYSFVAAARALEPILSDDASLITMTYLGSQRVLPNYNVMGVAKAALEACTRYLAYDLGDRGIRVNAVSPGPIMTVSARGIKGFSGILGVIGERAPLKRPAEQAEVAATSMYLLSDLSKGVTGQTIYVDAGYSVMGM
ncbi:MAG: enoyl-ACP reductase [Armatimonadota bacterium]|nr:enoyl-ACP reductase [Armatimonadota bacterium]